MKMFTKIFKSEAPKILIDLKVIRLELTKIQRNIERLVIMEQNMSSNDKPLDSIVSTIRDNFGVALWIKDATHKFIFANKVCWNSILKCKEDELESLTMEDFEKDELAKVCIASDKVVMEAKKTMRFIEYAIYENGNEIVLDVVKSPRLICGEVIGTIGSGVIVTESILSDLKNRKKKSYSVEIPLHIVMGNRMIVELLERRKDETRTANNDEMYQKQRTLN